MSSKNGGNARNEKTSSSVVDQLPLEIINLICEDLFEDLELASLRKLLLVSRQFNASARLFFVKRKIVRLDKQGLQKFEQLVDNAFAPFVTQLVVLWQAVGSDDPRRSRLREQRESIQSAARAEIAENYENMHRSLEQGTWPPPERPPPRRPSPASVSEDDNLLAPMFSRFRDSFVKLQNLNELALSFSQYASQDGSWSLSWQELSHDASLLATLSGVIPAMLESLTLSVEHNKDFGHLLSLNDTPDYQSQWETAAERLKSISLRVKSPETDDVTEDYNGAGLSHKIAQLFRVARDLRALEMSLDPIVDFPPVACAAHFGSLEELSLQYCRFRACDMARLLENNSGSIRALNLSYIRLSAGFWEEVFRSVHGCEAVQHFALLEVQYSRTSVQTAGYSDRRTLNLGALEGQFMLSLRYADWHSLRDLLVILGPAIREHRSCPPKRLDYVEEGGRGKWVELRETATERVQYVVDHYEPLQDYQHRPDFEDKRYWDTVTAGMLHQMAEKMTAPPSLRCF